MNVLLLSTYELGHQPLGLAAPAAALRAAGHGVRSLDLGVEPWDADSVQWADVIAVSVPMHTATRLAIEAIRRARAEKPTVRTCAYGLYAHAAEGVVDRAIGGEFEAPLLDWLSGTAGAAPTTGTTVHLHAAPARRPDRVGLPALSRYAHLAIGGEERVVGYVEASRGCAHRCLHCPVPVVYDGRVRRVDEHVVLDDVGGLVDAGAAHITFGDPDFLNAPAHSLRVIRAVHARHPALTFDVTVKVEHILRHAGVWAEFAGSGCLFVVSAFETCDDAILEGLQKGHTAADASASVALLRAHGIEVRPSWLPFTPWTTVDGVADIFDFVVDHDLVGNVDPVQYAIRLLVPPGSLLLAHPDMQAHLDGYDDAALSWRWHGDAAAEHLQRVLAGIAQNAATDGAASHETFERMYAAVSEAAERPRKAFLAHAAGRRPRLTEPWFC